MKLKNPLHNCRKLLLVILLGGILLCCSDTNTKVRVVENFGNDWMFFLGDPKNAENYGYSDSHWRNLNVPHDWSIEGHFSYQHPASPGGGALPGGVGWYRKTFNLPLNDTTGIFFIDFDGVYCNSDVWINGKHLGNRPNGYISFRYELTPYLNFGDKPNVIAVRADNSEQPNSRWYSGSGIYRNVWLVKTGPVHVDHWGHFVTTPQVNTTHAEVKIETTLRNTLKEQPVNVRTVIYSSQGAKVGETESSIILSKKATENITQTISIDKPNLWSTDYPYLYKVVSYIKANGKDVDCYETEFGVRDLYFDSKEGFFLNGEPLKILGVNNHHDLGCLGAAVNTRAIERQLEILKEMGCNAIRTAHNPPAPELLQLSNRMGFLVMNEAFDTWGMLKTEYARFDYHLHWDEWHKRDLTDFVKRDRNHPSVFMWSIGNEVKEQHDTSGISIAHELTGIIRSIDPTRPITAGCNYAEPDNYVFQSGALDVLGFNYYHNLYSDFPDRFPGQKFIAAETTSALATRGHYDMPSDITRVWPVRSDYSGPKPNADYTCSSYDNCHVPWGSTHTDVWRIVRDYDFLSGLFVWTGFDYLGEPTPYWWPPRSSYFGIVDLAGFPKDAYYMYKSEWTDEPVLHLFPHWNWTQGDTIDLWTYTNAEEVELFLNGESLGTKTNTYDDLYLWWRVPFTPGRVEAVGRVKGKDTMHSTIETAGKAARIVIEPDRDMLSATGNDLSFITVRVVDENGVLVPFADNMIGFTVNGAAQIVGVDNGNPVSHEPFVATHRKAFKGKCLAVLKAAPEKGAVTVTAHSVGLEPATATIIVK